MSLNEWSILVFAAHMFFYLSLIVATFSKPQLSVMLTTILTFIVVQIVVLLYGIYTKQIGFILLFFTQLLLLLLAIPTRKERLLDNQ